MRVQVNVKRFGKRRNAIETRPYEIGTVRSEENRNAFSPHHFTQKPQKSNRISHRLRFLRFSPAVLCNFPDRSPPKEKN